MISIIIRLGIICVILASCNPSPEQLPPSPIPSSALHATATTIQTSTSTPKPTQTVPPTPSRTPDAIQTSIGALRSSPYWSEADIPDVLKGMLDGYQASNSDLTKSEFATLTDFIEQWNDWQDRFKMLKVPNNEKLELRVKEFASDELDLLSARSNLPEKRFVLYAINTLAQVPEGNEQLYLLTPQKEPWALPVAPILDGLRQEISIDGKYVEYYDVSHRRVLKADAIQFRADWPSDQNPYHYTILTGFPRFSLNYPGIKATIYLMDPKIESHKLENKIDYAISVLSENPDLAPLKENLFSENFTIYSHASLAREREGVVGIASGPRYIQIDPGFDRREILLTLVHEAVHLLQGRQDPYNLDGCKLEIGDGTIPPDFLNFTGDDLINTVKNGEIGTVHVELWLASKISAPKRVMDSMTEAIKNKGRGIWDYCN